MRYFVCDVLDDLRAPRSRDELVAAGARLYECLADYHLRRLGQWSAKGKMIPRVLQQVDPQLGAAYCEAFAALFTEGDTAPVVRLAEGLLGEAGGPLFEGYKAEAPPSWRRRPAASTGGRSDREAAAEGTTADPTPAIRYSDSGFTADEFLVLAQRVWPGGYDVAAATSALTRTTNIGARDGKRLVGAVRVLTDGYFFATVPEILVDPDYQRRGIGSELMRRALARAPRGALFFGAQPESVGFFERLGCEQGPAGMVMRQTPARQPGA